MKAIILCAGKGERLSPLTENIPKPMIPINNKPILEYLILLCKKHSITEIAINTSYLPQRIKEYFGDGSKLGVRIKYSFEKELLGTSGALNNFRDFFNETFLVIYGDNITNLNLTEMFRFHKEKQGAGTIFVYREKIINEKTGPGYVIMHNNKKIIEIMEKPLDSDLQKIKQIPTKKKFINAGVYFFEPEILELIPLGFSDFARDVLPKIIEKNKLFGFQSKCYFKEVGQLERYQKAEEDIKSGKITFDFT